MDKVESLLKKNVFLKNTVLLIRILVLPKLLKRDQGKAALVLDCIPRYGEYPVSGICSKRISLTSKTKLFFSKITTPPLNTKVSAIVSNESVILKVTYINEN